MSENGKDSFGSNSSSSDEFDDFDLTNSKADQNPAAEATAQKQTLPHLTQQQEPSSKIESEPNKVIQQQNKQLQSLMSVVLEDELEQIKRPSLGHSYTANSELFQHLLHQCSNENDIQKITESQYLQNSQARFKTYYSDIEEIEGQTNLCYGPQISGFKVEEELSANLGFESDSLVCLKSNNIGGQGRISDFDWLLILRFLPLIEVYKILLCLNNALRNRLQIYNYDFFKIFIRSFNLPKSLKRSSYMSQKEVMPLLRRSSYLISSILRQKQQNKYKNLKDKVEEESKQSDCTQANESENFFNRVGKVLSNLTYATNGGVHLKQNSNFMVHLFVDATNLTQDSQFGKSPFSNGFDSFNPNYGCLHYSSYKDHDITLATYVGRRCKVNRKDLLVHNFKTTSNKSILGGLQIDNSSQQFNDENASKFQPQNGEYFQLDKDKYFENQEEEEKFKVLTQIDFQQAWPCYEKRFRSFMLFCAPSDTSLKKSQLLRFFNHLELPSLESFIKLGLPLRQIIKVDPIQSSQNAAACQESQQDTIVNGLFYSQQQQHISSWDKLDKLPLKSADNCDQLVCDQNNDQESLYLELKKIAQEKQVGVICEIELDSHKIQKCVLEAVKNSPYAGLYSQFGASVNSQQNKEGFQSSNQMQNLDKAGQEVQPLLYCWNVADQLPIRYWSIQLQQLACAKVIISKIIDSVIPSVNEQQIQNQQNDIEGSTQGQKMVGDVINETFCMFGQLRILGETLEENL